MSQELIIPETRLPAFAVTPEVAEMRDQALQSAALIGRVQSDAENLRAGEALKALTTLRRAIEKARKEAKAPVLDYGARIDAACKAIADELTPEEHRLGRLMGDYAVLLRQREAARIAAERADLAERERQRAAELAQARTHDEVDRIQEQFSQESLALQETREAVPLEAKQTPGISAKTDWEVTVVDPWLLARAHPACVKIMPLIGEIKALLDAGLSVAGVKAERVNSVSFRGRTRPIDV